MSRISWTKEEDDFLIENYPLLGTKCREELNKRFGEQEIGTVTVNKKGDSYIKVGQGKNGWILLRHFIVGDTAEGKLVIHLDRNKSNNDPNNLACVDRSTFSRLKNYKLYSENSEITKTGVMLCELIQALKDQEKGETNGGNAET